MTTIFAFSDSHNIPLPDRAVAIAKESDQIFFCGDGVGDVLCTFTELGIDGKLSMVCGNCDGRPTGMPEEEIVEVEGTRFLLTHGHRYSTVEALAYRAEELNCQVAVRGHSHVPSIEDSAGVKVIDCGSISLPRAGARTYAYIVVHDKELFANIVNIG